MFFDFVRHKDTPPTTSPPPSPSPSPSHSLSILQLPPLEPQRAQKDCQMKVKDFWFTFSNICLSHTPPPPSSPLLLYFYRTSIYLAIYLSVCLSVSLCFLLPLCLPNYKMLSILIRQTWQATLCVAFIKNASVVFLPPSLSASLSAVLLLKTGLLLRCLGICRLMGLPFAACLALPCLPP